MDVYTATELAHKNGYRKGYEDCKQDAVEECLQEIISYIDQAFERQRYDSVWIDENLGLQSADVGYAGEWWEECMKPELIRVFVLGGENEK